MAVSPRKNSDAEAPRSPDASPSPGARTPEEIEAELAARREALAASVDALAERVSPNAQVRQAAQEVKSAAGNVARSGKELAKDLAEQAGSLAGQARETVEGALEGDSEALRTMKKVAVTAGGAAAVAMLLALTRRD